MVPLVYYIGLVCVYTISAILYCYFVFEKKRVTQKPVDVKKKPMKEIQITSNISIDITKVKGIGPKWSEKLRAVGIRSIKELAIIRSEELKEKIGVSEKIATRWIISAKEILSSK